MRARVGAGGAPRAPSGKLRHNVKHHAQVFLLSHATKFSWRMRRGH
jgi:hypothetical protein